MLHEIIWDNPFDTAYGIITLPKNAVFYRGYSTKYNVISDRPAYFSSKKNAQSYIRTSEYTLSTFKSTHPLRLLDVRFMMGILRDLFNSNPEKSVNISVILSFGLCSLRHQVYLLNERYKDDITEGHTNMQKFLSRMDPFSYIEKQGVRVGETNNDAETMAFLKTLFDGVVDGFISPRLQTPYHVPSCTMLPEMILFNPKQSGIVVLSDITDPIYPVSINEIYKLQATKFLIKSKADSTKGYDSAEMHLYISKMVGGGSETTSVPTVEQINERWEEPEIQKRIKNGTLSAKTWKEHLGIDKFEFKAIQGNKVLAPKIYSRDVNNINERSNDDEIMYHPKPTVPITPWSVGLKESRKHRTRKLHRNKNQFIL